MKTQEDLREEKIEILAQLRKQELSIATASVTLEEIDRQSAIDLCRLLDKVRENVVCGHNYCLECDTLLIYGANYKEHEEHKQIYNTKQIDAIIDTLSIRYNLEEKDLK